MQDPINKRHNVDSAPFGKEENALPYNVFILMRKNLNEQSYTGRSERRR